MKKSGQKKVRSSFLFQEHNWSKNPRTCFSRWWYITWILLWSSFGDPIFVNWIKRIEKRNTGHNVEDRYIYDRVKRCTFKTQQ